MDELGGLERNLTFTVQTESQRTAALLWQNRAASDGDKKNDPHGTSCVGDMKGREI